MDRTLGTQDSMAHGVPSDHERTLSPDIRCHLETQVEKFNSPDSFPGKH